jgi:hypothetical protein
MAREPEDRYQSASELLVDLDRSNLAATVPSFTDPEQALQDPVVRKRLENPAQSTCPDLEAARVAAARQAGHDGAAEVWFLRYHDRQGRLCKAKATAAQIRERLASGKLKGDVEACSTPQGEYSALALLAKFRDHIPLGAASPCPDGDLAPAHSAANRSALWQMPSGQKLWLIAATAAALAVLGTIALILLFRGP